jgi:hypothetical protein
MPSARPPPINTGGLHAWEGPLPPLVEARQQQTALSRLVASVRRLPDDAGKRPQRRGSARGTYARRPYGSRFVAVGGR